MYTFNYSLIDIKQAIEFIKKYITDKIRNKQFIIFEDMLIYVYCLKLVENFIFFIS